MERICGANLKDRANLWSEFKRSSEFYKRLSEFVERIYKRSSEFVERIYKRSSEFYKRLSEFVERI